MGNLAPIILFVYNRPEHTRLVIESLKNNALSSFSDIYIFSDAAKSSKDEIRVNQVREFISSIDGFRTINISLAERNKGLAKSVIQGVTEVIDRHGKVIVLEDDIVTSTIFLQFMNESLDYYEKYGEVWSVSGYNFPFSLPRDYDDDVYFFYRASSWGWATWKDRWDTIDWEVKDFENYKNNIVRIFDFCKGGTDLDKMLRHYMNGRIDSWAIRWCYSQFCQSKLTVYPVKSLVNSIGTDGSGTNCDTSSKRFNVSVASEYNYTFINEIVVNKNLAREFRKVVNRSIVRHLESKITQFMNRKR